MRDRSFLHDVRAIQEQAGEFVVVTADPAGRVTHWPMSDLLGRVRKHFGMDVVFVSRFMGGERVIRHVAADENDEFSVPVGASNPLEESYCHHVVEGRLPEVIKDTRDHPQAMALAGTHLCKVGSHLAVPIIANDGSVYGTVCCFSHAPMPELGARQELEALRTVACLIAGALKE